jgi:hypothetical protein
VTTAPATRTPVLPGDTEASRSQRVIMKHGCPHPVNHPIPTAANQLVSTYDHVSGTDTLQSHALPPQTRQ